jgi:hypothetical protein
MIFRRWLRTFKRLRAINRRKPYLEISISGRRTHRPQVHISVLSRTGCTTLRTYNDTIIGNATATMRGDIIARITGLPLRDLRRAA